MTYIFLSILIQVILIIHVIKTGRNRFGSGTRLAVHSGSHRLYRR